MQLKAVGGRRLSSVCSAGDWFRQADCGVRFDWGRAGATALAAGSTGRVIVDVLSFTTSVTVTAVLDHPSVHAVVTR